ncbi:CDY [Mytilus coruscus]|uniref:CDY n=1 Tax=Mytilus coruscus TaxID=42192 RepID=A0A6J8DZZ7_MYTCO|nr:CDY [Mytilus coruscus]
MRHLSTINPMAENEVYEVENILEQREVDGQLQFFVKWKNFNEDWNTWEPVDNLLDCFNLILEFQEKQHDNTKKDVEKSKLARKEALKIVKKAKRLNSGSDNIKKALLKHAAIVNNEDVSLNLSVDTSVLTSTPCKKSPKSPKSPTQSPKSSPKSRKLGEGVATPINMTKRTPKKPSKLEEYFDPSKMFIKSSSKILSNGVQSSKVNTPSVLRTLLTTSLPVSAKQSKINNTCMQASVKLKKCTMSSVTLNSSKNSDALQKDAESDKITQNKSDSSQNSTKIKRKYKKRSDQEILGGNKKNTSKLGNKAKSTSLKINLKKSLGVKTLKTSDKNLKMKKTGNLLVVKMKPAIKKEKKSQLSASNQSECSEADTKAITLQDMNNSSVQEKSHTKTSQGEKKIVKKKIISMKIKKEKFDNKGKKKGEKKIITKDQTDGKKIKKQKTNEGKKVKVKKKNNEDGKKEIKVKGVKRKLEDCIEIIDTESDDDVEVKFSLSPKSKKAKTDNSPKRPENEKKIDGPSKIEKELAKKTLQVKVRPMETSSSNIKKMRLIDAVKPHPGVSKSAIVRPVSPTPVFTSVKPIMSATHTRPMVAMDTLCADVPAGYHYVPAMIPISPSSMSYKMLLDSLPFQFHTKKSNKKREDEMVREDDVERRMSVRQSECAYRYKEIVVKKCNRYTQIWLNTHSKLKNCLNPQANELLIGGRKITAIEACQLGLVSQVFWPTSIMQEVIPRIENMALQSGKALETTKLLIRSHQRTKIELTNESEYKSTFTNCNTIKICMEVTYCINIYLKYHHFNYLNLSMGNCAKACGKYILGKRHSISPHYNKEKHVTNLLFQPVGSDIDDQNIHHRKRKRKKKHKQKDKAEDSLVMVTMKPTCQFLTDNTIIEDPDHEN